MGILGWILRGVGSVVRAPFRLIDWIRVKLDYVSVPPLREFVYLDETSVVSLIASTTGGITEQRSTLKRRQISSSITTGLGGNTSPLSASVGATREQSSEAVRKYVIQSNFKELYDIRAEDMIISDEYEQRQSIPKRIWDSIVGSNTELPSDSEVSFERGNLIEVNVDLGSHQVYEFYTAMSSIAEIYDIFPEESEVMREMQNNELSLEELNSYADLIKHLLAGLVPIVGEVANHGVIVEENTANIISKEYAEENGIEYDPLKIVGFVDSEKFWQEETRFLFDDDRYTAYCRIDNKYVSEEWTPIKLASVVDSILMPSGTSLKDIPEAFETGHRDQSLNKEQNIHLRPRLKSYLEILRTEAGLNLESDEANSVLNSTLSNTGDTTDRLEGVEEAIEELEEELKQQGFDYDLPDDIRADKIGEILSEDFGTAMQEKVGDDWFLEVSFTAIYW